MILNFQLSTALNFASTLKEKASSKTKELTRLVSLFTFPKEEDGLHAQLNFNNVKIQRTKSTIFYHGSVSQNINIIGFIDLEGKGEEFLILRNIPNSLKKRKIIKFKTMINPGDLKGEYFTKNLLENLVRVRTR